jgi:hypothetical protein
MDGMASNGEESMEVREQAESSRRMALIALTSMLVYFAVNNHVPLYP